MDTEPPSLIGDAERAKFWRGVQEDYERLYADQAAWADYQAEIALWDATAGDGLEDEEPYYSPEEEAEIAAHVREHYGNPPATAQPRGRAVER